MDLQSLETEAIPATKRDLMDRIATARQALDEVVRPLSDDDLASPRPGPWRVQDHLAHIATWQRMVIAHMTDGRDHAVVDMDPVEYEQASLDELNDRIYEARRELAPAQARADYEDAHRSIVSLIDRLSDDEFQRAYWSDDPSGRTVMDKLSGDTYQHYLEHRRWILEALAY